MLNLRVTLLASLSLSLSACVLGPSMQSPQPAMASQWRNPLPESTTPRSTQPWWLALRQPGLNAVMQQALSENLDIQQAMARYTQATAYVQSANAALYPSANLNAAAGRIQQSQNAGLGILSRAVPGVEREVDIAQINLGASWELDFAGGLKQKKRAYQKHAEASADEVAAMRLLISAEVADAYLQIAGLQQARQHLANAITLNEQALNIVKLRVQLGETAEQDYQQQRSLWHQWRAQLPLLDSQIEQQRNRLAALQGHMASSHRDHIPMLGLNRQAEAPEQGLPGDLLRYRPDIRAAEARLTASHALIGATMAEYYPKISLSALLGQESNAFASLGQSQSTLFQRVIGLRWRLFDFGRVDAQVKQATAKHKEQWLAYQQLVIKATADAESTLFHFAKLLESEQQLQARKTAYAQTLQTAKQQLAVGEISQLTWLEKQVAAEHIDRQLAQTQLELVQAHIQVVRVLGATV